MPAAVPHHLQLAAFIEGRRCTLSELVSLLSTATGGNASADQRETWRTQIIDLAARKPYGAKDGELEGGGGMLRL
jgi:hypothetical protein